MFGQSVARVAYLSKSLKGPQKAGIMKILS
jgi:hypothetical protein